MLGAVGFEEIFQRRLGPMRDLVSRRSRPPPPTYDPATLHYRRALGVEVRVRPDDTWAQGEVCGPGGQWLRVDLDELAVIAGLTAWATPQMLDVAPAKLWRWVDAGLLYFSKVDPAVGLSGGGGVLAAGGPVARRWGVWPRPAMENAVEIKPVPFMPRGRDLKEAEMVGYRLASRERGHEVFGVSVTGTKQTGTAMRALMPLLDGTHTRPEILEAVGERLAPEVDRHLRLLDKMTALEPGPGPSEQRAAFQTSGDQVSWLGHAGVLYQSAGVSILVDPFFGPPSDPPERWLSTPQFDPRVLPKLDAILITHGDNDHLNPASLAQLPTSVPVLVPRLIERPAPYEVDIRGLLRLLGFEKITEVDPWASVTFGDVTATALPFDGEDWGLDLPQATWHVQSPSFSIFCAADSGPMPDVYQRLAELGRVDLAFMGVVGCAESYATPADYGYGNFYRDWVPVVRHNEWVQHCAGPRDAAASLALFEPRFAFGYAAGGASWIGVAYSDTGDHEQLSGYIRNQAFDTRSVSLPLGTPVRADALAELPED